MSPPAGPDLTLQQSGVFGDEQEWSCFFKNNSAVPITIEATAICLMSGT